MQPETSPNSKQVASKSRKFMCAIVSVIVGLALFTLLAPLFSHRGEVSTKESQDALRNGQKQIKLGDYEICNLETLDIGVAVPILNDGQFLDTYEPSDDLLYEGNICGTEQAFMRSF